MGEGVAQVFVILASSFHRHWASGFVIFDDAA